jgi:purine-binding chemotaxis protein CheW
MEASNVPALRPQGAVTAKSQGPASGEYLTFRLGSEEYGIDILKVQEIRSYEQPTRRASSTCAASSCPSSTCA